MQIIKTSLIAFALLGLLNVNAEEKMIEVGSKAPDFEVTVGETTYSLSEQLKHGPVALVFYRSGDW